MITQSWFWIFNAIIIVLLAIDLLVLNRKAHEVKTREAVVMVAGWVAIGLAFALWIGMARGVADAKTYLFAYSIEYMLSVDNIFVFVLLFTHFRVPAASHHRVLFWGILSAIVMRGVMIAAGVALLERFHWVIYVFGAFLVFTGLRMMFTNEEGVDPERSAIVRVTRRFLPMTEHYDGARFTVRRSGKLLFTPLALVLVVVNLTDLVFAVDSIPAVLGITKDPFLVYTSNICAVLGLRSLYFLLASAMKDFGYLKYGLALILCFIGVKMLIEPWIHVSQEVSMIVVLSILAFFVLLSLLRKRAE